MPIIKKGVLYLLSETKKDLFAAHLASLEPGEYEVHVHGAKPTDTMVVLAKVATERGLKVFARNPSMTKALNEAGVAAESKMFSLEVQGELEMPFVALG